MTLAIPEIKIPDGMQTIDPKLLKHHPKNVKVHTSEQIHAIAEAIKLLGWFKDPLVIDKKNVTWIGNGRLDAALLLNMPLVPFIYLDHLTTTQKKALMILDNKLNESKWNIENTVQILKEIPSFDFDFYNVNLDDFNTKTDDTNVRNLQEMFITNPFSILDAKQGPWQKRKREWLELGIRSEIGRKQDLTFKGITGFKGKDHKWAREHLVSIFDPVLCEVMYYWFCKEGGKILDPFAGGSVRGIVAGVKGFQYTGIDLSEDQIKANFENYEELKEKIKTKPNWIVGDSTQMDKLLKKDEKFDFMLSCPPYHDLEKYSKNEKDISNMSYSEFQKVYADIIGKGIEKLKENSFACIVIQNVRDKNGFYKDLVSDTVKSFESNGMRLYNDMILATSLTSAALRAANIFIKSRKIVKVHQNVLIFFKGEIGKIPEFQHKLNIVLEETD